MPAYRLMTVWKLCWTGTASRGSFPELAINGYTYP